MGRALLNRDKGFERWGAEHRVSGGLGLSPPRTPLVSSLQGIKIAHTDITQVYGNYKGMNSTIALKI